MGAEDVIVYEDSILVVKQAFKEWAVKEDRLQVCSSAKRRELDSRHPSYVGFYMGK